MMSSLFLHLLGLGQQKAQYPSQEAITQPFHLYFHHTLGLQGPSYFYLEDYFPNIPRLTPFRLYFQLAFIWGLIRSFPSSKKHLLISQARQARWQGSARWEVDTIKNFPLSSTAAVFLLPPPNLRSWPASVIIMKNLEFRKQFASSLQTLSPSSYKMHFRICFPLKCHLKINV